MSEEDVELSSGESDAELLDLSIFLQLPNEIFVQIFGFLPLREIVNCRLLNSRFASLVRNEVFWKNLFHPRNKYDYQTFFKPVGLEIEHEFQLYSYLHQVLLGIRQVHEHEAKVKKRIQEDKQETNLKRKVKMGELMTLLNLFFWVSVCLSIICPPLGIILQFFFFLRYIYDNKNNVRNYKKQDDQNMVELLSWCDFWSLFCNVCTMYSFGCCVFGCYLSLFNSFRLVCISSAVYVNGGDTFDFDEDFFTCFYQFLQWLCLFATPTICVLCNPLSCIGCMFGWSTFIITENKDGFLFKTDGLAAEHEDLGMIYRSPYHFVSGCWEAYYEHYLEDCFDP